jgi:hypothetical protein
MLYCEFADEPHAVKTHDIIAAITAVSTILFPKQVLFIIYQSSVMEQL